MTNTVTASTERAAAPSHRGLSTRQGAQGSGAGTLASAFAMLLQASSQDAPSAKDAQTDTAATASAQTPPPIGSANTGLTQPPDAASLALAGILDWQALAQQTAQPSTTVDTPDSAEVGPISSGRLRRDQLSSTLPVLASNDALAKAPTAVGASASSTQGTGTPLEAASSIDIATAMDQVSNESGSSVTVETALATGAVDNAQDQVAVQQATPSATNTFVPTPSAADVQPKLKGSGTTRSTGSSTTKAGETLRRPGEPPSGTVDPRKVDEVTMRPTVELDASRSPASVESSGLDRAMTTEGRAAEEALTDLDGLAPTRGDATHAATLQHSQGPDQMSQTAQTDPVQTQPFADVLDEVTGQIAYWASQGTQRATLSIDKQTESPLEIKITMADGEVHVAFEASGSDMREALNTHANSVLKPLLEEKGMTLTSVSVDVGQQDTAQQQADQSPSTNDWFASSSTKSGSSARTSNDAPPTALSRRQASVVNAAAGKVDLFA